MFIEEEKIDWGINADAAGAFDPRRGLCRRIRCLRMERRRYGDGRQLYVRRERPRGARLQPRADNEAQRQLPQPRHELGERSDVGIF